MAARAAEVIRRCQTLFGFSEDAGSTRRTFLSPPMHDCHREIAGWMQSAGMSVTVDAAGNLRGYYAGVDSGAPRLLIGSHLDTVPNAGAYDGILGVVIAVALLEALEGKRFPFGVEVIGFSEEEGVRFNAPFIGSRALVGTLDDGLLDCTDANQVSVREAIRGFGLEVEQIPKAALGPEALGYLEFHIEQGPVLESLDRPLAAVDAIAGQSRLQLTFTGKSNHAGTTPMHLRQDALAAAAEWISAVEQEGRRVAGLVATVGSINVKPGAINVIAGEVQTSLDVRHSSNEVRTRAVQALVEQAQEIATRRGASVTHKTLLDQRSTALNEFLVAQVEDAIRKTGCEAHRMASGAGHDAMILAQKIPAAMIFLRTPGGISHHPAESVRADDVSKALGCGLHLLSQLAASPTFHGRTKLA